MVQKNVKNKMQYSEQNSHVIFYDKKVLSKL